MRHRTRHLASASLMAALLAASAWIAIPLQPVPFTLQVLVVILAALLLPPAWAAASVAAYVAIGAAGLPVFSGARGGLQVLAGPTGGYLFGFVAGAFLGALAARALRRRSRLLADVLASVAVVAAAYTLGWLQLMAVTGLSPAAAFAAGVAPFLPLDAVKAVLAIALASSLRAAGVLRSNGV